MSGTQDLGELMAARRADLEGTPTANGAPSEVEVIPPAPSATGSEAPPAADAPAPAGPVEVRQAPAPPVATGPPITPDATFPSIPPKVLGGLPYANSYSRLAFSINKTEMVPRAFRGNAPALMAAFMYGYEVGLGPMQAANGINVIDGSAGLDAETMRALILDAGHIFVLQQGYNEDTGQAWASVFCRRKDWPADIPTAEFTWTSSRGERAGLVEWYEKWITTERGGKRKLVWNPHSDEPEPEWVHPDGRASAELKSSTAWKNYPEAMCGARVTSEAARANFADVVKGLSYTPEEIREFNGGQTGMPAQEEAPPSTSPSTGAPAVGAATDEPTDSTGAEDGSAGQPSPPSPSPTTDPSPSPPQPSSAPPAGTDGGTAAPAKKAPKAKKEAPPKAEPIRTENPQDLPGAAAASTESAPPPAPAATSTAATQPDLEGKEPEAPANDSEVDSEEAGVIRELATSLRALLQAKPQADRTIITAFLGRHFPNRKAEALTPDELTKAINIAAGWPNSADTYPAPEFPPTTVDGDGQPY